MAEEWIDLPDFPQDDEEFYLRSAELNAILGNQRFLHDRPAVAVRRRFSAQMVAPNTDTAVVWSEAVWDKTGEMWTSESPSKILIVRDGLYTIAPTVLWGETTGADTSKRAFFLHVNGQRRRGFQVRAVQPSEIGTSWETTLLAGDSLDLVVRHGASGNLGVRTVRTVMTVKWDGQLPFTPEGNIPLEDSEGSD